MTISNASLKKHKGRWWNIKTKKKKTIYGIVLFLIIVISGYFAFRPVTKFNQIKNLSDPETIIANNYRQQNKYPNDLTYIFVWKAGCPDCKKIEKQTADPINALVNRHRMIVINARHNRVIPLLKKSKVHTVPTLIVQRHHKVIYQYSGNNSKKFLQLLTGHNPNTGKKLTDHFVSQNDFDHK